MSNKFSNDLFQLIQSLSRTEKAYFKKYTSLHVIGERNNYVKLFNAIEKQKENSKWTLYTYLPTTDLLP